MCRSNLKSVQMFNANKSVYRDTYFLYIKICRNRLSKTHNCKFCFALFGTAPSLIHIAYINFIIEWNRFMVNKEISKYNSDWNEYCSCNVLEWEWWSTLFITCIIFELFVVIYNTNNIIILLYCIGIPIKCFTYRIL